MIAITGASGQLGRLLTQTLAQTLRGAPFRALSRGPEDARRLAGDAPGAVFARGDFDDAPALADALAGVDRLLVISTADPNELRIRRQTAAISAARRAGVKHVVYLSFLAQDPSGPFPFAASHHATEEAVRTSGLRWTILRPSLYLDALELLIPEVAQERAFFVPAGSGRASFVSRADLARAITGVLTSDGHEGKTIALTGTESLSYGDVASKLTRALGEDVRYVDVSDDEYRRRASALGPMLEPFVAIWRTIREGHLAAVTRDAEQLAGAPLTTVDAWLADRRDAFGRRVEPSATSAYSPSNGP